MENSQVKDIAVGAMIGHWPAHLGLTTDSEKIEWLARQVERLADASEYRDDVSDCETCDLCEVHQ